MARSFSSLPVELSEKTDKEKFIGEIILFAVLIFVFIVTVIGIFVDSLVKMRNS